MNKRSQTGKRCAPIFANDRSFGNMNYQPGKPRFPVTASAPQDHPASHEARRAVLATMRPDTLHRIEQAVLKLFSQKDFHEVSLIDGARTAHVSLQTIYKYFGSKEVLVYAMLDVMLGRLAERMLDHLQGIDDVRERLRKTCWVTVDYMDKHPAVIQLFFTAVPVSRHNQIGIYESPELMGAFRGVLKDGQARGVLNNKVSSKVLLDVFMGIIGRVILMHIVRGEKRPLIEQFDDFFDIVWRAMSNA